MGRSLDCNHSRVVLAQVFLSLACVSLSCMRGWFSWLLAVLLVGCAGDSLGCLRGSLSCACTGRLGVGLSLTCARLVVVYARLVLVAAFAVFLAAFACGRFSCLRLRVVYLAFK